MLSGGRSVRPARQILRARKDAETWTSSAEPAAPRVVPRASSGKENNTAPPPLYFAWHGSSEKSEGWSAPESYFHWTEEEDLGAMFKGAKALGAKGETPVHRPRQRGRRTPAMVTPARPAWWSDPSPARDEREDEGTRGLASVPDSPADLETHATPSSLAAGSELERSATAAPTPATAGTLADAAVQTVVSPNAERAIMEASDLDAGGAALEADYSDSLYLTDDDSTPLAGGAFPAAASRAEGATPEYSAVSSSVGAGATPVGMRTPSRFGTSSIKGGDAGEDASRLRDAEEENQDITVATLSVDRALARVRRRREEAATRRLKTLQSLSEAPTPADKIRERRRRLTRPWKVLESGKRPQPKPFFGGSPLTMNVRFVDPPTPRDRSRKATTYNRSYAWR